MNGYIFFIKKIKGGLNYGIKRNAERNMAK